MTIKNHSKVCMMVSAAIMVVALVMSIFGMGINLGIDFAGGLAMQYSMGGQFEGYNSLTHIIFIWKRKVLFRCNITEHGCTIPTYLSGTYC